MAGCPGRVPNGGQQAGGSQTAGKFLYVYQGIAAWAAGQLEGMNPSPFSLSSPCLRLFMVLPYDRPPQLCTSSGNTGQECLHLNKGHPVGLSNLDCDGHDFAQCLKLVFQAIVFWRKGDAVEQLVLCCAFLT